MSSPPFSFPPGFRDIGESDKSLTARQAISQILFLIGKQAKVLRDPLSDRLYTHSAGLLVEGVAKFVISSILTMGDLSVQDGEELPRVLKPLVDDILGQVSRPSKNQTRNEVFDEVARHAGSVAKLACILEIIQLKLAEIVGEWLNGAIKRRGVTREELSTLIEAMFNDSPLRREALAAIAAK